MMFRELRGIVKACQTAYTAIDAMAHGDMTARASQSSVPSTVVRLPRIHLSFRMFESLPPQEAQKHGNIGHRSTAVAEANRLERPEG